MPNFATAWLVTREPWHVLPRHLLLCQPRRGQPAGPYLATRAGAKRLSHERKRPPEACEHLWPYHSVNDSHIYGSVPVTWTHATWWHLLLQFLSDTKNRYPITLQSIPRRYWFDRCFRELSEQTCYRMCYFRLYCSCDGLWWFSRKIKCWGISYLSFFGAIRNDVCIWHCIYSCLKRTVT